MVWRIFERRKTKRDGAKQRDVKALTEGLKVPAVHLVKTIARAPSFIGGVPVLPENVPWPMRDGRRLGFIAQIDLAEVQATARIDWLPASGALLVFYDAAESPWGFDPQDRGSWVILHLRDVCPPGAISPSRSHEAERPLAQAYLSFRGIESYPRERASVSALSMSDEESDAYSELCDSQYGDEPKHQIAGFPAPVQDDFMELQCQLASNGVYCGEGRYMNDPATAELSKGAGDWRLLLQVDTDDDISSMWGDAGTLYFFVREQDARAADFSNVWLILQCC